MQVPAALVICPVAFRGSGRKDHAWLSEACFMIQVRIKGARARGSRNTTTLGCEQGRACLQGKPVPPSLACPGALATFAGGGSTVEVPGTATNPCLRKDASNASLYGLKNKAAVKSVMPHYCFLVMRDGLPSRGQHPRSSGSRSGKRLQTRVSWTAGFGSISSSLFEGTLRGKYGKSQRVHAGRLTREVWPGPGERGLPATGVGTASSSRMPGEWHPTT